MIVVSTDNPPNHIFCCIHITKRVVKPFFSGAGEGWRCIWVWCAKEVGSLGTFLQWPRAEAGFLIVFLCKVPSLYGNPTKTWKIVITVWVGFPLQPSLPSQAEALCCSLTWGPAIKYSVLFRAGSENKHDKHVCVFYVANGRVRDWTETYWDSHKKALCPDTVGPAWHSRLGYFVHPGLLLIPAFLQARPKMPHLVTIWSLSVLSLLTLLIIGIIN